MSNQEITHKDESGAESFKFTQRGYMWLNPETLEWNYCNPAFSLRSLADIKRIVGLETCLINMRELLDEQKDKSCLGIGYPANENDCAPWPIIDEAINEITRALKEPKP
jgi:hypothetical protein